MEKKEIVDFDYLQCSIPDIHGSPRGRMVPKHLIPQVLKNGFGIYQGIGNFGMNMEIHMQLEEYTSSHFSNGLVMPIPATARAMQWSSTAQRKTGHAIGSLLYRDGQLDPVCSRHTAQRQLARLEKMNLKIKAAYELEFMMFEGEDASRPLGGGKKQFCNMELLDEHVDFFMDLLDSLRRSGLPVEFFNNEADEGQYEITMEPRDGLEPADAAFLARYGIRAFSRRRGYSATFMTRPAYPQGANGFHLNHSLWTRDGKDVFFDAADPLKLSLFARQWIAGLLLHTPALCALYCPTVNCYQRFNSGMAPRAAYWAVEDRVGAFRVKTSDSGAYLENRLPSSACNPYLVLAATVAAGLDGVERQLECPQPGPLADSKQAGPLLPKSLAEALEYLQKDTVLREAVGTKVVDYFTVLKRDFEIKHFEDNATADMSKAERVELERKYYMPYL
ncbi:lengsin-like isoform X2 [Littorina saxatilis]|uniref:Lengsin n=2 Tax=Littorina saxatilis TaxID=31220 RepID=A0AAN9GG64_9CAEN